ncbi:hypothetical protein HDU92_005620 [Lobulomyces angularis]|nr:hypothetical protein HDU92_005620 [Lobulomyces angularis]
MGYKTVVSSIIAVTQAGIIPSISTGEEGTRCGGYLGLSCVKGLKCISNADKNIADAGGFCRKVEKVEEFGGVGKVCGGFLGLTCEKDLECHITESKYMSDASGVCIKPTADRAGLINSKCGGFVGIKCLKGLKCVLTDKSIADSFGVCERPE